MQLQRAVLPARVNASAKLFAIAVLFAGLAAGATIAMIQTHLPRTRVATPAPSWRWDPHDKLTYVELGRNFTLSTHVHVTGDQPAFEPILSNGEIMLGLRGDVFELDVFERSGQTLRFENSTKLVRGSFAHVAITRSGSRISLWVDGNETRIEHDAATLPPERLAVANRWRSRLGEVSIWNRVLGPRHLAALR